MLPLAMPAYVMAFTQIGLLDFSGVLQSWLREVWGSSAWFPPIRSRGGVVLVMSLALYPYVYLLARDAFASQGRRALEAAQSLGLSPWQGFGGGAADGAAVADWRRVAGLDGGAGRFWHGVDFQFRRLHHGDL